MTFREAGRTVRRKLWLAVGLIAVGLIATSGIEEWGEEERDGVWRSSSVTGGVLGFGDRVPIGRPESASLSPQKGVGDERERVD